MSSLKGILAHDRLTQQLVTRNYLLDVALGRVKGSTLVLITGVNENVSIADGEVTIMDLPSHRMVFPTAMTDVWVSSTNNSDTSDIFVSGLAADFTPINLTATLNGQTPVNIGQMRHLQSARAAGSTPVGNIYFSKTNSSTLGVPDDLNDTLSFIVTPENVTHNAFYMVPKDVSGVSVAIRGNTDAETKPAIVHTNIIFDGDIPLRTVSYSVSPAFAQFIFPVPLGASTTLGQTVRLLPEGTIVEFSTIASANNTRVFFGLDVIEVNNKDFAGQPVS